MTHLLKPFQRPNITPADEALRELEEYIAREERRKNVKIPVAEEPSPEQSIVEEPSPEQNTAIDSSQTINLRDRVLNINYRPLSENGKTLLLTQDEFIDKFNSLGKVMISMPDLYLAGKYGDEKLLKRLRHDMLIEYSPVGTLGVITSTRILYHPDGSTADIIHYYGSKVTAPTAFNKIIVPAYPPGRINEMLGTTKGRTYLKALFNTTDNAKTIKITIMRFNLGYYTIPAIWTQDDNDTIKYNHRMADIHHSLVQDNLWVNGFHLPNQYNGISYGVNVNPITNKSLYEKLKRKLNS